MTLKSHITVGVCVPSGPEWDADFGMCLVNLFVHMMTRPMKGVRQIHGKLYNERSSLLPKSRQGLLEKAVEGGCDYALFVDSDQVFPSNTLYRLLQWDKSIVACNIATKSIPANPTARNPHPTHPGGDRVYSDPSKHGLEEVWRVGTGVMLIKLATLSAMPKPWFGVGYDPQLGEFQGEDWFFCEKLERMGVKIYVDHDLSREIGHRGHFTYAHHHVGEVVRVCEGAFLEASENDMSVPICSKCKQEPAAHV